MIAHYSYKKICWCLLDGNAKTTIFPDLKKPNEILPVDIK